MALEHSFVASTSLLVISVMCATMLVVHNRVGASLVRGLEGRGISIAKSIGAVATPSLLAYNYAALQVAAEGAADDPDLLYVAIHDKEGGVAGFAGSGSAKLSALPPMLRPLYAPSFRDVDLYESPGRTRRVLEAVVPVRIDGVDEAWGTVRVGIRYDPVRAELRRLEYGLALIGLVLAAVAFVGSRWMARRVTAPLRGLVEGTEALALGDTSHRIEGGGARELAELAQAFNMMLQRVEEKAAESTAYQSQLARLNATLEAQVRQRTRALGESEAQYRTLVEHSPDSILIVQRGRVRFVNRAFEETFGVAARDASNLDFRLESLFEARHAAVVSDRLRSWENGESTSPAVVTALDSGGAARELELRGSRTEYRGQPAAECLLVDMTEAKRLREELEDSARLRSLGELAGGVAHDFNNLLGAVLGRAQLLRKREFDTEVDADLAVIEKAALDGRETVRRIQEFSRTRKDQQFEPVDLREILRDAMEITRTRWSSDAQRRNVTVRVVLDCEEVPSVLGNATELREVFTNLILNSVDAMPQGGQLKLRCMRIDKRVRCEVEDTGVGMTEEIRRHLFDPFFTTKGQAGTGLGMSVAYGIVSRHEGSIDVNTALGLGSRFTLEFPACDELPARPSVAVEPRVETCAPGRILVIDDEQPIAELLEDALSAMGHAVQIATSGREGVRLAGVSAYDLVLTDLGMPDISGWDVATRIRANSPGVPVVLVTGWGSTVSAEEVRDNGIAAVVHKPFEIEELLETTARVLASSAPEPSE
jgi:PAS domain S-box-containing protein